MQVFGTRFTEYVLTGAVFWIAQIGTLVAILTVWPGRPLDQVNGAAGSFPALITGVLTALAFALIIVTGLALDVPRWSTLAEAQRFAHYVRLNRVWLTALFESLPTTGNAAPPQFRRALNRITEGSDEYEQYYGQIKRWITLYSLVPAALRTRLPQSWLPCLQGCTLQQCECLAKVSSWRNDAQDLLAFLLGYIASGPIGANFALVQDQLSMWRTNRGITLGLAIIAVEGLAATCVTGLVWLIAAARGAPIDGLLVWASFGPLAVFCVGYALSHFGESRPYSRMLHYLFPLALVTYSSQHADAR